MKSSESIFTLSEALVSELIAAGKSVAIAESCTGGWIAKSLTDVAGSSQCFAYGIVSYSNAAKESILGVLPGTLQDNGAVSEPVAREMAAGVIRLSGADLAVAVSGVAGPDGGTDEKPVGTVWLGWALRARKGVALDAKKHMLKGDRADIRAQTVILALQGLRERLRERG
jgi:nicotinamide-nucleotide amidase